MRLDAKLMSKTATPGAGPQSFERGNIKVMPGRKMPAAFLKVTVPVKNTTGGALALSDANRQLLLALFMLTVTIGAKTGKVLQPFIAALGTRIQREARRALNIEIPGYSDAVTGLATSMANNATTSLVFFLPVPVGAAWYLRGKFKDLWGVGPSQAQTMQIDWKVTASNITAGWDINGNVTIDLFPGTVPAKGDEWSPVPLYEEATEVNKFFSGNPGLLLALDERTNVQASNPTTSVSLEIGGQLIYDQLAAADFFVGVTEAPLLLAAGLVSDRESIFYEVTDGETEFNKIPVGTPKLTQNVKDLATFQASYLRVPILTAADDYGPELDFIAKNIRHEVIKAVSVADVYHLNVPDEQRPFMPCILFSQSDKQFEMYAGLVAYPDDRQPQVMVPASLRERTQKAIAQHKGNGEHNAAADVAKRVAAMVPGAVQGTKGFATTSGVHNVVAGLLGS